MVFRGELQKEGKFWVISVPDLEITTQGRSKKDAYVMIADAIKCHVDKPGFRVKVAPISEDEFVVSSKNESELIALFLKRQRQVNNLSVREVAKRIGYASASAYAQYETGRHIPGLDKIARFIAAMNPKSEIAVEVVTAG